MTSQATNPNLSKRTKGEAQVVSHSWSDAGIYIGGKRIALVNIDPDVSEETQDEYRAIMDADAAYLALAWNCHDDLMNALEEISELRVFDLPAESTLTDYDVAISIIRKARGLANIALGNAKGE